MHFAIAPYNLSCATGIRVIQLLHEDIDCPTARGPGGPDRDRIARAQAVEVRRRARALEPCGRRATPAAGVARCHRRSRRFGAWPARRPEHAQEEVPEGNPLWPQASSLTPAFWSLCSAAAMPIIPGRLPRGRAYPRPP